MRCQIIARALALTNVLTTVSAVPAPHRHRQQPSVRLLYQYPVGTWVENLAVRENGQILLTLLTAPQVDLLDPFQANPTPETIFTFPNVNSVQGIAEVSQDVFLVSVGNFSQGFRPNAGSFSAWSINASSREANKIVDVPEWIFPDGIVSLPNAQSALVGDIRTGRIYRVDPSTSSYEEVIFNSATAAVAVPAFGGDDYGVNGIRIFEEELYFTNTGTSFFGRMRINGEGRAVGETETVLQGEQPGATFSFDDFAIRGEEIYFVTGGGNSVERIGREGGGMGSVVVGNVNSTQVAGPTSCAFGRTPDDSHILYIVTSGALASPVDGNMTVGAQVLAVDVGSW